MNRLEVLKTNKLFIGGQFVRTESGRHYELKNKKGKTLANMCLASKKDFRNAVVAARKAFLSWSQKKAFNRSQILYRIAEMLEGRKFQLINELVLMGATKVAAKNEIERSIDRLVYYAGWCDKFQSVYSSVNPVSNSYFNFSLPEPSGVVSILAPEKNALLGLISCVAPVIAGGNTCVILASNSQALCAITFAEILATSDLPDGVINILTGSTEELHSHMSSHMDVNAIVYCENNKKHMKLIQENCSFNVKRFFHWYKNWNLDNSQNPYLIMDTQEIKSTWHPIENIGVGGANY